METWDENATPIAYLITFRSYGTWLHGDERGSIDRYHNLFRAPRVPANPVMQKQQEAKLKSEPVILCSRRRPVVEASIRDVCSHRLWRLSSISVRTNHAHVVVSAGNVKPENVMRDFKAYSTRALKAAGLWSFEHSPWAEGGSKRYLWKETSVANAYEYVINGQGADLPETF